MQFQGWECDGNLSNTNAVYINWLNLSSQIWSCAEQQAWINSISMTWYTGSPFTQFPFIQHSTPDGGR